MDFDMTAIRNNIKTGTDKAADAFENAKGLTVGTKGNFAFFINSAKQKKNLVDIRFDFDKQFPFLRFVGVVLGAMALALAVSAFLDGLFGKRSDH